MSSATLARPAPLATPAAVGWTRRWAATTLVDSQGTTWEADTSIAVGGQLRTTTATISGTGTPQLYQSSRLGITQYVLPLPAAGTWHVVLFMANTDGLTPGQRVFDVTCGGVTVDNVDVAAAVGGSKTQPYRLPILVATTDPILTVTFTPVQGQPAVCGIALSLVRTSTTPLAVSFSDDFTGGSGTSPSAANWTAQWGGGGWGNNELQGYTGRAANVSLDGASHLAVTARQEQATWPTSPPTDYTSARLNSVFRSAYGRIDAVVQVPGGAGLLPAFWLLGANIGQVGWPACGEIDVMETLGSLEPGVVHATVHGPTAAGGAWADGRPRQLATPLSAGFHRYSLEWWPGFVQVAVDGVPYLTTTPADLQSGQLWVFDHPFYLLLNVAVGGNWAGAPPLSTTFPETMLVDSVTWWQ